MGSLFVQYGTKAGGVSYIYNFSDLTAYSGTSSATANTIATCDQTTYDENTPANNIHREVQTRTRTGSTYSYDCSYTYGCAGNCSAYSCSYDCSYYGYCCGSYCYVSQTCNSTCYNYCSSCCTCTQSQTCTGCNWSGWSGWTTVSSCSASAPGCSNGATQRECQTRTKECIRTEV